jgi:hypothetical protein
MDRRISDRRLRATSVLVERRGLSERRSLVERRTIGSRRNWIDRRGSGLTFVDADPS